MGVSRHIQAFYYNKYFRKTMTPKYFGVTTNSELCDLAKDVAGPQRLILCYNII